MANTRLSILIKKNNKKNNKKEKEKKTTINYAPKWRKIKKKHKITPL